MKRLKFIVEQGGETKVEERCNWYVIRVKDRMYRHVGDIPAEADQVWSVWHSQCPYGWESFPIWPGTEPEEIEVRARLEVSNGGELALYMNDAHAALLVTERGTGAVCVNDAIDARLQEIREGKP